MPYDPEGVPILNSDSADIRPPAAPKPGGIGNILKAVLRTLVRLIPGGKGTIEPWMRDVRLKARRWLWARQADSGQFQQENFLTLDPAVIEICPNTEFAYSYYQGRSEGGDWDLSEQRFDRIDVYEAIRKVCQEKSSTWQDTAYYKRILSDIEAGKQYHDCKSAADLDARCAGLSQIYESMQRDGYKSQEELGGDPESEVAVAIGREGRILFSDGAHRLAMAKLLGIREIPVVVAVRHPEWAAFRAQLKAFCKTQPLQSLYQQARHPDLYCVPAEHGCEDRYNEIEASIPVKSGRMLDIGSNLAYMCHRFEDMGFDCTAVEIDETHLFLMEKIKKASDKKFEIRAGSFMDDAPITEHDYEVVLALNIFHHMLKEQDQYEKLIAFLQRLKTNIIVFEPHLAEEPQMDGAYRNFPKEEFCAFVMEHTGMTQKKRIFGAHDGREVFVLSR